MTSFSLLLLACSSSLPLKDTGEHIDAEAGGAPGKVTALLTTEPEVEEAVGPVRMPRGKAIVRQCYGRQEEEGSVGRSGYGSGAGGYGSSSSRASAPRKSSVSAAPPPAPASAPASVSGATADASVAYAPPPVAAGPATESLAPSAKTPMGGEAQEMAAAREPASSERKKSEKEKKDASLAYDGDAGNRATDERDRLYQPPVDDGPQMDWGGVTYLSNDDSMSLASAQRLLWAVKSGTRFGVEQVRPHELLNYFSFDTAPVKRGNDFSVLASASQTGPDTLSLAMAVKGANPPRQPLDLTLVVDRSGSMSAEGRMEYVKRGLTVMADSLKDGDRVDIVLFDDQLCVPLEDFVVGRDDRSLLLDAISDMQPRGSTDMNKGLREGYRLALGRVSEARSDKRNQRLMVLTDAWLNTGEIRPDVVTEIGKGYDEHGIRLTGVGVGREFNDKVLDQLTEKGKGAYVYLGSEAVVDRVFGAGFDSLTRTLAHDVRFALDLPPSLAIEKFYGEESSTNPEDVQPINYYAGTTQVFLQDLKIRPGWLKESDPVELTVTYKDAITGKSEEQKVRFTVGEALEGDLHNLDKARALISWSDLLIAQAMGGDPCGQPLATYQERAARVTDDAEMAYVNDLVSKRCGVPMPVRLQTVAYKVKINSDMPIAEVAIQCGGSRQKESLSGGDTVVSFNVPPGSCALTLEGAVPMNANVRVPETGGEVRCMIRGGRLQCS